MTVSAQTPINRSTGNGVTTVFPYTFKIISAADIEVSIDDVVKTLNVDYTVTGAGVDAGGNVTMTTAPADGTSVVRRRNMALVRTTDYQDQGTLPAATLDNDIDNVVLMVQQVDEQIGRALTAPPSLAGFNGEIPAPVDSYVLGIKPDGSGFQYYGPADSTLLTAALAASSGSSLVGYMPAGSGAGATTVQNRLRRTASDLEATGATDAANYSQLPCYAAVSVNLTRTVLDKHAFEDWSALNVTSGGSYGYCSFDAKPTLTNSVASLHLVGFQARPVFAGSSNLTQYLHGYDTAMVHNGAGTITEASGVNVSDITGTGKANITNFYGLYIATLTAGATRYGIYSDAGNSHMLGGTTGTVFTGTIQAGGLNYNNDAVSKSIAIGFGTAGQTQFGTINFYNGKNTVVASFQNSGLVVTGAINASGVTKSGSYTVATLPVASEGYIAYATDGRKTGQGAGAGTGVPVYYSAGAWRRFYDDAVVTA